MTKSINKAQNGFVLVVFDKEQHYIKPSELKVNGVSLGTILEGLSETQKDVVKLSKLVDVEIGNLKKTILELQKSLIEQQAELNNQKKIYQNAIRGFIERWKL